MVETTLLSNLTSISILVLYVVILAFPRVLKYSANGLLLIIIGGMSLMYEFGLINYDIIAIPIMKYLLLLMVALSAKELCSSGFKEHGKLRFISIFLAVLLIIITTIPALYSINAITFNLPEIPMIVLNCLYIMAGIVLVIGAFMFKK